MISSSMISWEPLDRGHEIFRASAAELEVAGMVAWVASPACSYSTGACFDVSGGRAQF
jgi:NAD(P)-dependent dehydrogenase (short-subunit alcohol dehydrogenase family)